LEDAIEAPLDFRVAIVDAAGELLLDDHPRS